MATFPEDDALLAGELALAVLEGDELAEARRRQLAESDFAEAVRWWEARLARMAEAGGAVEPSADMLKSIHTRIDALGGSTATKFADTGERLRTGPSRWSIGLAALGTALAAAAIVLFVSAPRGPDTPAPVETPAPTTQLVAQLQDENGARSLAGIVDPQRRTIALSTAGLEADAGRVAELWVIPADGVPRSLGTIPGNGRYDRELTEAEAAYLQEGSSLAVTFEQDDGVPHTEPTLPILLVGPLDQV